MRSLDMTKRTDQAFVRRATSRGWKVRQKDLLAARDALMDALELARKKGSAREITSAVKTLAVITAQIQSDEQLQEKFEQGEKGNRIDDQTIVVRFETPGLEGRVNAD